MTVSSCISKNLCTVMSLSCVLKLVHKNCSALLCFNGKQFALHSLERASILFVTVQIEAVGELSLAEATAEEFFEAVMDQSNMLLHTL